MKKYLKGMILFICIMVTLSACGGREIAISQEEKEEIAACPKVSLVDTHVPLAHRLDKAVIKNGVLHGCFQEDTGLTVVSDLRQTTIPHATNPQSITADAHGNVYVLAQVEEDNVFWKIDREGQLTLLENFVLEDLESSIRSIPKGLFVDDEGLFYIWYGVDVPLREFEAEAEENVYTIADRIYVKDSNLNTLYYKQVQDSNGIRLQGFCFQENGTPTLLVQDMEGTYMQELSRESTEEDGADKIYIEGIPYGMECENITLMEGGFLFCQGNSLYQYSFAEQAYEKMLDFATYGISASDIIYLGVGEVTDDIVIEIVDNYGSGNNSEYTILQEGESSKMLLTLGTMQAFPELEETVTAFNRFQEDLQIEMITYYEKEKTFEEGLEQLKLDIVRGKAPDILEVSLIDYEMLAGKDMWVDLYEYMAQDEDYKKEMLIPNVATAYELGGHLYSIAPEFQIYSMWGNHEVIQGRYGLTFKELKEILQEKGKGLNAIYGFSADEPVLTNLCAMGMDTFIDWENRTCNFEGEDFLEVLEFAKSYTGGYAGGSLLTGIREGETLMTVGMLYSVADYQLETKLYGGDIDFIGYPCAMGSGTVIGFRGSQLAINKRGQNPDAAWEFIKYYLLNGYSGQGFPVLKEQFEERLQQDMEKQYVESVEGTCEMSRRSYHDMDNRDVYLQVYEASKEDVAAIKELVERADGKFQYHVEIQNIINEETASYFAGQKSAEEVAALIQNRVGLYLKE